MKAVAIKTPRSFLIVASFDTGFLRFGPSTLMAMRIMDYMEADLTNIIEDVYYEIRVN